MFPKHYNCTQCFLVSMLHSSVMESPTCLQCTSHDELKASRFHQLITIRFVGNILHAYVMRYNGESVPCTGK